MPPCILAVLSPYGSTHYSPFSTEIGFLHCRRAGSPTHLRGGDKVKSRTLLSIAVMTFLAVLAIRVRLPAQRKQADEKERSTLKNLDEFGKTFRQVAGACIPKGQECRPNIPCCPGLKCTFEGLRAFCEPIPPPPPSPTINTLPPPSAGALNLPYSFTFTAQNGILPLRWSETGALPVLWQRSARCHPLDVRAETDPRSSGVH